VGPLGPDTILHAIAATYPLPRLPIGTDDWVMPVLGAAANSLIIARRLTRPKPKYIPLPLGSVTVDLQPTRTDTIHTVIGGTSGLGKSTTVLPLLDLPIGVLVLALDNTRPIANYLRSLPDGIEWSNEPGSPGWGIGLDVLKGAPSIAAEALVAGWTMKSAGDTGKYRDIARDALVRLIEKIDEAGGQRSLFALATLMVADQGDAETNRACRDWARRIKRLSDRLGPCLGSDLDLVTEMRARKKVLLRLNSFLMPEESPFLAGMFLVMARRAAQEAGVPFVLIIEEAGQLQDYTRQIIPLTQAGRDRGVPVVLLTQNMALLPPQVINNVTLWVSFAQESKKELEFAAERVGLDDIEMLKRKAFRRKDGGRGWAYVRSDRLDTRLVKIKQIQPRRGTQIQPLPDLIQPSVQPFMPPMPDADEDLFEDTYDALPEPSEDRPVWVTSHPDRQKIWKRLRRATAPSVLFHPDKGIWYGGPCLEFQNPSKDGRPRIHLMDGNATAYIEVFKWAGGEIPPSFTIDHLCGVPWCCEYEHLEAVTNEENVRRRSARVRALALLEAA
jgi:hypothetical protein